MSNTEDEDSLAQSDDPGASEVKASIRPSNVRKKVVAGRTKERQGTENSNKHPGDGKGDSDSANDYNRDHSASTAGEAPMKDGKSQSNNRETDEDSSHGRRSGGLNTREERGNRGNDERSDGRGGRSDRRKDSSRNQHRRHRTYSKKQNKKRRGKIGSFDDYDGGAGPKVGSLPEYELFNDLTELEALAEQSTSKVEPIFINNLFEIPLLQLVDEARASGIEQDSAPNRTLLVDEILKDRFEKKIPLYVNGCFELMEEGYGLITYQHENYQIRQHNVYVPPSIIKRYGLLRGHMVEAQVHPHREDETCPFTLRINKIMSRDPEDNSKVTPFEDLIPYYPLERFFLETNPDVSWDNISMRVVDLLTPIGLGQRGLIVAPPRTGKTVLLQGIANSIAQNNPDVHLIVLLIDERPEEVTDFQRQVKGEVISSTFDETAWSHVHAAEMVIEKSRRLVEVGQHVVILLDSITRLARAYNTLMPSSGKILSGGVEASALQKPKRFFGSARNIEGGGSLTIIATALIDTGSRMDEVIFEEFKGTGNMELHLDRGLVDKRVFPSLSMERSGTRKEELLYHPDELGKIYSMRRAMKGVPSDEAVEMLIQRVRKTKSNAEFLMSMNR